MNLPEPSTVRRVGIIGAGTIGASWAAYFLARGLEVDAWDPAPDAEEKLRTFVGGAWPVLEKLDCVVVGADPGRVRFHADPAEAAAGAEFVQESAPEHLDVKQSLYAEVNAALSQDAILASSTSGLLMSEMQAGCSNAARFVVGHPFNPPHLIPLVEVLGGAETDPRAVDWAIGFYNALGKKAIRLNREVSGHLVNRLQAALLRECADAVLTGLASVEDVDVAVKYGPGLRLGVMGPYEICHLAGGTGGYAHFLDHLGDALRDWMNDLEPLDLTPEVRDRLKALVDTALGGRDLDSIANERDELLLATLTTLAQVRREKGLN